MKKFNWFFGILFVLATLISCNEDILFTDINGVPQITEGYVVDEIQQPVTALVYQSPGEPIQVCNINTLDLTAGQSIDAGSVEVFNDETNLYVTFNTLGTFGTLHLWVGTELLNAPKNKQGIPVPGDFDYQFDATGLQHYTFIIPLANKGLDICGASFYLFTHAEVSGDMDGDGDDDGGQTAWGGSLKDPDVNRWYFYDQDIVDCCTWATTDVPNDNYRFETAYAKPLKDFNGYTGWVFVGKLSKTMKSNPENYYPLNLTQNRWGWVANLNALGTYTYDVWAGAGLNNTTTNGVKVGTATVDYTVAGQVTVTYNLTGGAILSEVHIYANDLKLWTIAPGQYGFNQYFELEDKTSTFTVILPIEDVSEATEDGIWICLHAVVGIPVQ